MNTKLFRGFVAALGAAFTIAFVMVVIPELLKKPDVLGAFAAGFVNPFASGYAMDAITCWCLLAVWVAYEAKTIGVRHGWVAVVLGLAPGVATGLAAYLLIRLKYDGASTGLSSERATPTSEGSR